MIHITDYPCFHEQGYYTPGDTGAPVYRTKAGDIGVAICYDRHYPEYMRALALGGADLVVVPQAGAVGEWPDGLVRSGDAGRRVPERLLRRALQPRRRGGLPDVRRRVVRLRAGRPRDRAGAGDGGRAFSPRTSTSRRRAIRTHADCFCSTAGRSSTARWLTATATRYIDEAT